MPKIAETYLHFKIDVSPEDLSAIKDYLKAKGNIISKEVFGKNFYLEVRVENGSLKAWIIAGGILYTAIAGYGSFRSGIDYIVKDSRWFSQLMVDDFGRVANIKDDEIVRIERRLGVPGKIQRLLKSLNKLKYSHFKEDKIEKKLTQIEKELVAIFQSLDSKEDYDYLHDNLLEELDLIFDEFKANTIEYSQIKIKIIDLLRKIPFRGESEYPEIPFQPFGIIREEDYSENISRRFLNLLPPKSD